MYFIFAGLTRLFPDLKVLEYEDSNKIAADKGQPRPHKPSSLPVHRNELMKLNSISVKISRSQHGPTPSDIYTQLDRPNTFNNAAMTSHRRPLFRPVTRKDIKSTHNSNTGYTSIVSSRLMPYLN